MTFVFGRVCIDFSSLPITTMDSLGLLSFCTIGFERVVSCPHFGHASTTDLSFCMGSIARLHFGQNIMPDNDRVAYGHADAHLTVAHFSLAAMRSKS
jgi:hypothetical protein